MRLRLVPEETATEKETAVAYCTYCTYDGAVLSRLHQRRRKEGAPHDGDGPFGWCPRKTKTFMNEERQEGELVHTAFSFGVRCKPSCAM